MDTVLKFTSRLDRRSPYSEGDINSPTMRENWVTRDGILKRPLGTTKASATAFASKPTWATRYHTFETGIVNPKSFIYTQDGKIWHIDDTDGKTTQVKDLLNENAYPKSWLFKIQTQNLLYFVDGLNLYKHDGNNDHKFEKVKITDTDGDGIKPIDVIEHKDRLFLISEAFVYVSENLNPDVFNSATDSIQIVVGSGKGKNLALGKIEDNLYILNTEGIFVVVGDVISALASTFEVRLVDERRIIAGRTAVKVEKAIIFLADDYNIWSWDGNTTTKLSHSEKLEDFVNTYRSQLDKACATYFNNYYMMSFVEKGQSENKLEIWWDAFENKIDFIRDRDVACYMITDPTVESPYMQFGHSTTKYLMWADRGYNFDDVAIESRLRSRDITPRKGQNVRFTNFYIELSPIATEPTTGGVKNFTVRYHLDGQLSDLVNEAFWTQEMIGVTRRLGIIYIQNQTQVTYKIRPRIYHSRGQSIQFFINDSTLDLRIEIISFGFDIVGKAKKVGRKVGA